MINRLKILMYVNISALTRNHGGQRYSHKSKREGGEKGGFRKSVHLLTILKLALDLKDLGRNLKMSMGGQVWRKQTTSGVSLWCHMLW